MSPVPWRETIYLQSNKQTDHSDCNTDSDTESSTNTSDSDFSESKCCENNFLHMPVHFKGMKVAALLDSGSSISVMSAKFYNMIPQICKGPLQQCDISVQVADAQQVKVIGVGKVKGQTPHGNHSFKVHIFENTSHPFIIGTDYMSSKGLVLDFTSGNHMLRTSMKNKVKVKCMQPVKVEPNTEVIIQGKLPKKSLMGVQGIVKAHKSLLDKGLLLARSVTTIPANRTIPIKILNPGNDIIHLAKGMVLADFAVLDESFCVIPVKMCNNARVEDANKGIQENVSDFDEFCTNFDFNTSNSLSEVQSSQLKQCLYNNKDVFVTKSSPSLGFSTLVEHEIHLKPNFVSKYQRPYRLPPDKREVLRSQLDELLSQGVIAPVHESDNVPITSPIVLVAKRKSTNGSHVKPGSKESHLSSYRFCCDFRYLNSQTQDFVYHIPDVQELTESFSHVTPNYISSIDMSSGFFQMGISGLSSNLTAFNTCFGTYKFLRLPMGLKTAPNSFQLLMDKVLKGLVFKSVLCYLDDAIIVSETFEQHLKDINEVLDRFRSAGLRLGPRKCKFACNKAIFLGHEISKYGIRPPADRVEAIKHYPIPTNVKELRRALGLLNWFRKFIPHYSALSSPLHALLKKSAKFIWRKEHSEAFQKLKGLLMNSSVLAFPRFDVPFHISVDTSSKGLGYMLYQLYEDDKTPHIIRFGSKGLNRWQQSYGPTKLELLGVVTAVTDCASYIRGSHCIIECDHQALRPLQQNKLRGAIYERWLAIIQQFDVEIQYKPASQMVVPDALSRCHPSPNLPVLEASPDEEDPYFPSVEETLPTI